MTIAEMTLEQLQDYALTLEGERDAARAERDAAQADAAEVRETNLMLQNRNNELFLRVEQAQRGTGTGEGDPEPDPQTLEEFATENIKTILG